MDALKRSVSLDLTDSRASHNSLDSGYTSDLNSPDVASSDHSLPVSRDTSHLVLSHSLSEQSVETTQDALSNVTSPTVSDQSTLTDLSSSTSTPNGLVNKPVSQQEITQLSENTCRPAPDLVPNVCSSEIKVCPVGPISPTVITSAPHQTGRVQASARQFSKLAEKFESCSSDDKLEFVSYYVAIAEQRILKNFIAETFTSEEDEVTAQGAPDKFTVTTSGEARGLVCETPPVGPVFFDSSACEDQPGPTSPLLQVFATPTFAGPAAKLIVSIIETPSYNLGLKPYRRKHIEPDPSSLNEIEEYDEMTPVILEHDNVYRESDLERPCSLTIDFHSSLESVNIEEFLVLETETSPDRFERTLHLSQWGRWRRSSVDLPAVLSQHQPDVLSSRYAGRELPPRHGKRSCKLFLPKKQSDEELEDDPPVQHVSPTLPELPVATLVSSVKRRRREPADLTFVGFNALSHFKHTVNAFSLPWIGLFSAFLTLESLMIFQDGVQTYKARDCSFE